MIKELNYYLTTNRFSQIAEDIENSVREYAASFENKHTGDSILREKTRILCEEQLVLCGLRTNEDSFINIDTEFFEGGELVEANLNRFIKDVLKAHGYQKILWEYMGTTGLMTEVSKSAMENDGFSYEKYLPVSLQKKEAAKKINRITRNFDKLKDESGFNWNQSYDPNYTVTKKDWSGAFDENNVWNYYKISDIQNVAKHNKNEAYSIKVIKTQNGCMLYDSGEILLNPIILWYLTHEDEVYGVEESNTKKIVEEIRDQMKIIGVEKITEVAISGMSTQNNKTKLAEYKKVLGTLADNKIQIITKDYAEKQIINNQQKEKTVIIQKKSVELQNKIEVIKAANPEISTENLIFALETGKASIALDVTKYNDAVKAGFADEEYHELKELIKSVKPAKRQDFIKACTIISSSWENYKSCGKSKIECINLIYNYLAKKEVSSFTYEKYLKDILLAVENNPVDEIKITEILNLIENNLPEENKEFAKEYISSLPEQKVENRKKVFNSLQNAIKNYLVIRSSTGMSIKELFNYAIKSSGGTLPKLEITPPTIGYITPGMQTKVDEGNKRIFFETSVEELISELVNTALPTKEVSIAELENEYEELKVEKPVVVIGNSNESNDEQMVYNSSLEKEINPLVLAILKTMMIKSLVQKSTAKTQSFDETKNKIITIAKKCETQESFVEAIKTECNIEYNFSESIARQVFTKANIQVSEDLLTEYANDFEETAQKQILSKDFIMGSISNVKPVFTQVDITKDKINAKEVVLPTGFKLMESKPVTSRGLEEVSVIQTRHIPVYSSNDNSTVKKIGEIEQKTGVVEPVETTNLNENIISLIETTLTKTQKEELLHICNDDWNIITPLLVKEYLWRKKNKKSVKNIVQEVQAFQKINSIPQDELEKYLESQNLASVIEHKNGVAEHKNGVVELVETTNHKENVISLNETTLTKTQKEELLHICNNDEKLITPLLVEEYKWRKENKKSVENIVQEVQTLKNINSINISSIPQEDLEKYLESQNLASVIEHKNGVAEHKNGVVEHKTGVVEPVETTNHKENVISLNETTLTKKQKEELLHICNDDTNLITPLLVKEYLSRKENKKSLENIVQEVKEKRINVEYNPAAVEQKSANVELQKTEERITESTNSKPVIKLTTAEKQHFRMDYGLPTEGISPVIKEYIQSGEWKTNRFGNVDGITGNGNHSYEDVISGIGNKNSGTKSSTIKVSNNKAEHVNVDEPYSMSPELKETFKEVSRSRKSTSRNDSSSRKEYIDSPINAFTNSMSPEEVKMSRINANYEHDKAVLAKSDPVFAKNQFWDVGHAEESGELSERDVEKMVKGLADKKVSEF